MSLASPEKRRCAELRGEASRWARSVLKLKCSRLSETKQRRKGVYKSVVVSVVSQAGILRVHAARGEVRASRNCGLVGRNEKRYFHKKQLEILKQSLFSK